MNYSFKLWLSVFFTLISLESYSQNSGLKFKTEGIDEFYRIVDILKSDKSPSEDDWNRFNSSPGYDVLTKLEFGKNYLRDIITVSFKPSEQKNESEVINRYKKQGNYFRLFIDETVEGYKSADSCRESVMKFVKMITDGRTLEKVKEGTGKFIDDVVIDSTFAINFIVFSDSRGYDPIIIGITNPDNSTEEEHILLVAHELFHNLRNKRIKLELPKRGEPDSRIMSIINSIHNEGIADMINVHRLYTENSELKNKIEAQRVIKEQKYQKSIIMAFDILLSELSVNKESAEELEGLAASLITRSGHPAGYFMAKTIYQVYGENELKRLALKPFEFFYVYSNAARKSGLAPGFSNETLSYLNRLEAKYFRE
ncbi:MAG: DUF5700 domain-containing putative Zn-dependent protease [Bacteroidales bacterium]